MQITNIWNEKDDNISDLTVMGEKWGHCNSITIKFFKTKIQLKNGLARSEQMLHQRKYSDSKKAYEKIFNLIYH